MPLEAALTVTVNDVDGRAATATIDKVLHSADRFIGLRATFTNLPDGGVAGFDVALVDGDGMALGSQSLKWNLVKEDYTYNYFTRDGRWQSNETVSDTRVDGGEITLDAKGRGKVSAKVTNGRWRIEAYDASGKTATSVRFESGWWATSQTETRKPEIMPVSIDAHPPAGKVRAMIEPSFAGRVLVMLDGNGLHGVQEIEMKKGGGAVLFDAADVPAAGAYVLAVAVSPAGAVIPRLPVRAVGLAWVAGAKAAHKLDVALTAPDTIHPQTALAVDIAVKGMTAGEDAYVTLAAVDEAVLRMTDFATPDAAEHFLGRREPGFELRDVYNQLIDPVGTPGRLTQGGDGNANVKTGGLDVKTFKTVALFKGPVTLDADGHARISVDVPDFSGRLRLMAQAWSAGRFGSADRAVTVRPPLLAELTLPRFLAPGDSVRARLMLTDLDAPGAGLYDRRDDHGGRDARQGRRALQGREARQAPLCRSHAVGLGGAGHRAHPHARHRSRRYEGGARLRDLGAHAQRVSHAAPDRRDPGGRQARARRHIGPGSRRRDRQARRDGLDRAVDRCDGAADVAAPLPLRVHRADDQPCLPRTVRGTPRRETADAGRRHRDRPGCDPAALFDADERRRLRLLDPRSTWGTCG